jgi:hypothetical protein
MVEVHQGRIMLGLQLRDASIAQHIRQTRRHAGKGHGQGKGPDAGHEAQRRGAERHEKHRDEQNVRPHPGRDPGCNGHGGKRADRGGQDRDAEFRVPCPDPRLDVRKARHQRTPDQADPGQCRKRCARQAQGGRRKTGNVQHDIALARPAHPRKPRHRTGDETPPRPGVGAPDSLWPFLHSSLLQPLHGADTLGGGPSDMENCNGW